MKLIEVVECTHTTLADDPRPTIIQTSWDEFRIIAEGLHGTYAITLDGSEAREIARRCPQRTETPVFPQPKEQR